MYIDMKCQVVAGSYQPFTQGCPAVIDMSSSITSVHLINISLAYAYPNNFLSEFCLWHCNSNGIELEPAVEMSLQ